MRKRNKNRPEGGTRNRKRDKEGWGDEEGAEGEGKRNRRKKNQNLTETEYENDEYTDNSDIYQADYSLRDLSEYVGTVDYVTAKVQFRKSPLNKKSSNTSHLNSGSKIIIIGINTCIEPLCQLYLMKIFLSILTQFQLQVTLSQQN